MKQFIVLFGMLSVTYAALEESSFRSGFELRVMGGNEASIEDIPYQAALLHYGIHKCGAVIIGPETLLTAAHCVHPSVIRKIQQMRFRVGSSKWRDGGKLIAARKRIIHELYEHCETCYDYDIAIIELAEKIDVPFAVPIPLAEENETFPNGALATVSGWGATLLYKSPETLSRVVVPLVDYASCLSTYGSDLSKRNICTGSNKGMCNGDSGGPLTHAGKLIGIVSFSYGCAKYPGVYSSIAKYRKWIRQNSGI